MKLLNRYLRPAGDRIRIKKEKLHSKQFDPFEVRFYQSGTAALASAVIASFHIKPDISVPEVILPAYGCPDLISAVVHAGAKPVLIDLEPNTPWMSFEKIKCSITKNSVALIAVNFLGITERMENLRIICQQYGLVLIEDSAQGFPISTPDKYWRGDYNIISFGRGKPVNMLSGGAVLTIMPDLIDHLPSPEEEVASFVKTIQYIIKVFTYNLVIIPVLYNFIEKLPWLSIGETVYKPLQNIQPIPQPVLDRLSPNIELYQNKNNIIKLYQRFISELDQSQCKSLIPQTETNIKNHYLRFPLLIYNESLRNILYQELKFYGASIMYRTPLPSITGVENILSEFIDHYPNALSFSNCLLTLPTHEDVTHNDIQEIQTILTKHLGKKRM